MRITFAFCFIFLLGGCGAETGNGRGVPRDMSGGGGDGGGGDGMSTFDRDAACAMVSADGTLVKKPVDIIFVIDNSGSMADEIKSVQANINVNFAAIIGASGLDYRVIMISEHGDPDPNESICVSKPLSGHDCAPAAPLKPINTANFFHYSRPIESNDSWQKIISYYNLADPNAAAGQPGSGGFKDYLRDDSIKVFVEITDDREISAPATAAAFTTALYGLTPKKFGDAANPNFVWHTIGGFIAKAAPSSAQAWGPTEPEQTALCTYPGTVNTSVNSGIEYQRLSVNTGGLRFPICEVASYDAVFKAIAMGVVKGAQVACEFLVPTVPPPQTVNLSTVLLDYTPSNGGPQQTFTQVANAAACGPSSFYIEAGKIVLCPDTCTAVKGDVMAKVKVFFDCEAPLS